MRRLVPRGFVFVFVAKQHIQALCRQVRPCRTPLQPPMHCAPL
jgi:hypothetical protein